MSKTASPAIEAKPVETAIKVTLQEFCIRLSQTVSRPELIGAFEHHERVGGRLSDTEKAFRARFDAFVKKPV